MRKPISQDEVSAPAAGLVQTRLSLGAGRGLYMDCFGSHTLYVSSVMERLAVLILLYLPHVCIRLSVVFTFIYSKTVELLFPRWETPLESREPVNSVPSTRCIDAEGDLLAG